MGGYGSTRWSYHRRAQRIEDCVRLSVRVMRPALAQGPGTVGTAEWEARGQGKACGKGQFRWWIADSPATDPTLWLEYDVVDRAGRREPHCYGVPVLTTRPYYGGVRYWFGCPQCARRVGALYLPAGARRFACRHCLSLVYRSQQVHDKFLDPYRRMDPVTRWAMFDRLEESHVSTPAPDFAAMSVGDLVQWLRADFRAWDKEERILRTFQGPTHSPEFYDKRRPPSLRGRR